MSSVHIKETGSYCQRSLNLKSAADTLDKNQLIQLLNASGSVRAISCSENYAKKTKSPRTLCPPKVYSLPFNDVNPWPHLGAGWLFVELDRSIHLICSKLSWCMSFRTAANAERGSHFSFYNRCAKIYSSHRLPTAHTKWRDNYQFEMSQKSYQRSNFSLVMEKRAAHLPLNCIQRRQTGYYLPKQNHDQTAVQGISPQPSSWDSSISCFEDQKTSNRSKVGLQPKNNFKNSVLRSASSAGKKQLTHHVKSTENEQITLRRGKTMPKPRRRRIFKNIFSPRKIRKIK